MHKTRTWLSKDFYERFLRWRFSNINSMILLSYHKSFFYTLLPVSTSFSALNTILQTYCKNFFFLESECITWYDALSERVDFFLMNVILFVAKKLLFDSCICHSMNAAKENNVSRRLKSKIRIRRCTHSLIKLIDFVCWRCAFQMKTRLFMLISVSECSSLSIVSVIFITFISWKLLECLRLCMFEVCSLFCIIFLSSSHTCFELIQNSLNCWWWWLWMLINVVCFIISIKCLRMYIFRFHTLFSTSVEQT